LPITIFAVSSLVTSYQIGEKPRITNRLPASRRENIACSNTPGFGYFYQMILEDALRFECVHVAIMARPAENYKTVEISLDGSVEID
jgi:hypothetical protein